MTHPLGRSREESLVLGCLTRLAMCFQGQRERTFTGEQVATAIVRFWQNYELSKDTPEIRAFLKAHGLAPEELTAGENLKDLAKLTEKSR